jgi:serine/threonine-protein kinase
MKEQELRGAEANERELPYVAPEVLMGGEPSAAADVFTAAVLIYQMATGTLPFRAASLPVLIGLMLTVLPRAAGDVASTIPEAASAAIMRALAAKPAERFGSAREFAAALTTA